MAITCSCEMKDMGGWFMRHHVPGCSYGAGLTGGDYTSAAEHEEGRAAVDESMALDDNTIRERQRKGGP